MPKKKPTDIDTYTKLYRQSVHINLKDRLETSSMGEFLTNRGRLDKYWQSHPEESDIFYRALDEGIYKDIEKLSEPLCDYIGAHNFNKFKAEMGEDFEKGIESPKVQDYISAHCMDPGFRLGLSMARSGFGKPGLQAEAMEHYANISLMKRTLSSPNSEQLGILQSEITNQVTGDSLFLSPDDEATIQTRMQGEIADNHAAQRSVLTQLYLCQLGDTTIKNPDGSRSNYSGSMTELYAHGGRTAILLEGGEHSKDAMDHIIGENYYKRGWATHSASITTDKDGRTAIDETRTPSHSNNYGLDLAVGGIGSQRADNSSILRDGSNGHLFVREGLSTDPNKASYILFGVETTRTGATNYFGKNHDPRGNKSRVSGMYASKQKYGNEYGGRIVDLTGVKAEKLSQLVQDFQEKVQNLQTSLERNPSDANALAAYNKVVEGLTGPKLTLEELRDLSTNVLGMNQDTLLTSTPRTEPVHTGADSLSTRLTKNCEALPMQTQTKQILAQLKKTSAGLANGFGDSKEMKQVKKALKAFASTKDNPVNVDKLKDMMEACSNYLSNPSKNTENMRYHYVKQAFRMGLETILTNKEIGAELSQDEAFSHKVRDTYDKLVADSPTTSKIVAAEAQLQNVSLQNKEPSGPSIS